MAAASSAGPPAPAGPLGVFGAIGLVSLIWGTTFLAVRVMVETIPPLLGGGARFLAAGLMLLAVQGVRHRRAGGAPVTAIGLRQHLSCALIGFGLVGSFSLSGIALEDMDSGLAALLFASVPLWIVILRATLGRQRVPAATLLTVALGFAGVGVLAVPGGESGSSIAGVALMLTSAALWAAGAFGSTTLPVPHESMLVASWQMIWGSLAALAAGVGRGELGRLHLDEISPESAAAVVYLLVISSGVAFTAYSWLVKRAPISQTATWAYISPLIAVVAGWLVLDEPVGLTTITGAALIVTSVAATVASEARAARPPQPAHLSTTPEAAPTR